MTDQITIRFAPGEGAIGRIVTLVERRGFVLHGLAMREEGDAASMTLDLVARDASRRLDVLDLQLKRLIGVSSVSIPAGSVQ
ncbi:MAG: ACT domain-containing protein [Sphingomicrobium sp.]